MFFIRILCALVVLMNLSLVAHAAPLTYYLGNETNYDASVQSPDKFLHHEIGQQHIRHDQLLAYFKQLASQSDRVAIESIGRSYQQREQVLVAISSPENLANLDAILEKRDRKDYQAGDEPVVVWLGYSVHGDEISGSHAALVVAYHLSASTSGKTKQTLDNAIIVMEPSINPDGMDRFANWVATFSGFVDNSDANHIEHHQMWPTGRTNHYWFDLNRDWLLLTQQESVNRLKHFHRYQPNVVGDFHEMGANSSYFFQPGIPSRTNPLTPAGNIVLTQEIAKFHAKALDADNRLYYSEESFDDFYYGKGSTYPDVNGAVGILFEQASSRGQQQETINGLLTFDYGIKNHVLTSFSTIDGAVANQTTLKQYRQAFYAESLKQADKQNFAGYIVHESNDEQRMAIFLKKLAQHHIDVYPLASDFRLNGKTYPQKTSYYIPLEQVQYRMIEALFSTQKSFQDNTFYDVSGWTLPLAMNITFEKVDRAWGLKIAKQKWQESKSKSMNFDDQAYAYAIDWGKHNAPKLLSDLLANNINVKVATKPFSSTVDNKPTDFARGTLLIAAGIQQQDDWRAQLKQASEKYQLTAFPIATGLTSKGIDLGSSSFKLIKPRKVLLVGGQGISQYEAGEIRYFFDQVLAAPLSIIEHQRLNKVALSDYSHIILVDGNYKLLSQAVQQKLEHWLKSGGTIIAQKRAAKWLNEIELLSAHFASKSQLSALFDTDGLQYQDKEKLAGKQRIAGAIFEADLDLSHPLAYGYNKVMLPMFKNSTVIMDYPNKPFIAAAKYTATPLMSGYTDKALENRIAHNTPVIAHNYGRGKIIASSENLAFRGYWLATAKLLANALYFDHTINASAK